MLPPRLQGSRYPGQDSEPRPIVPQLTEDSDGDDLGDVAYLRWPCCRYLTARLTSLCLETPPRVTWCPPVITMGISQAVLLGSISSRNMSTTGAPTPVASIAETGRISPPNSSVALLSSGVLTRSATVRTMARYGVRRGNLSTWRVGFTCSLRNDPAAF